MTLHGIVGKKKKKYLRDAEPLLSENETDTSGTESEVTDSDQELHIQNYALRKVISFERKQERLPMLTKNLSDIEIDSESDVENVSNFLNQSYTDDDSDWLERHIFPKSPPDETNAYTVSEGNDSPRSSPVLFNEPFVNEIPFQKELDIEVPTEDFIEEEETETALSTDDDDVQSWS